jgi:phage/conjugal plasmid C-4 type zinc finger TraR family protein
MIAFFYRGEGMMADEIDIANDLMANEVSRALNKIRENGSQDKTGAKICIECGESIPEARRKLGFKLCVPCAEEEERRKALFADY